MPTIDIKQYKKIPYDIDGTLVGYRHDANTIESGIAAYYDAAGKSELNDNDIVAGLGQSYDGNTYHHIWFIFPEKRTIEAVYAAINSESATKGVFNGIWGSNDSTDGVDGTWTALTGVTSVRNPNASSYKDSVCSIDGSPAYKMIRLTYYNSMPASYWYGVVSIHLYGKKYTGETPNDIVFTDNSGIELTTPKLFGNIAIGAVAVETIRVKNISSLAANTVNLNVDGSLYLTSLDNITFDTSQKSLGNIAAGELSAPVYVKANCVGASAGLVQGRLYANVASFA